MAIHAPKMSFSGPGVISPCSQSQTSRNNAQAVQKIYCALLRDMVCYISELPVMETIPVISLGINHFQNL